MANLGTAWVTISASTAGYDSAIANVHTRTIDAMNSIDRRTAGLQGTLDQLHQTFSRTFRFVVVYEGVREALSGIRQLIEAGLDFDKQMETARVSFASAFMQHMDFKDQFGHAVTGVRELNAALALSDDAMKKLEYANLKTTATFSEMVKAYEAALPAGLQLGLSWQQTMDVTTRMMQVAGAMGWDKSLMGQELRELLRGNVTSRSPLSAIISGDDVKRARGNADLMLALIDKVTKAYGQTGKVTEGTFEGVWSNLKTYFIKGVGAGLQGTLFDPMKELMAQWLDNIVTIDEKTQSIHLNPDFVEKFASIGRLAMTMVDTLPAIVEKSIDIAATLGQWCDAVRVFGAGLAGALIVIGDMLKDITSIKDILVSIIPSGSVEGVPGAARGGIVGAVMGLAGRIPGFMIPGSKIPWVRLNGIAGAGAGLGLGAGYESMVANQKAVNSQNTLEAMIGLGGAGAIAGGLSGGAVSMGTLTIPGAAVGALIGAATGLTHAIISWYNQVPGGDGKSVTRPLPQRPLSGADSMLAIADEVPTGGSQAIYGKEWLGMIRKRYTDNIDAWTQNYSKQYGVPADLTRAVIGAESHFDPNVTSPKGAMGLGQLMPGTAKDLGVANPYDPEQNIRGTSLYLSQLIKMFPDSMEKVIAAYNAGPQTVKEAGGVPNFDETKAYVDRVIGYMDLEGSHFEKLTPSPKNEPKTMPEGLMDQGIRKQQDSYSQMKKNFFDAWMSRDIHQAQRTGAPDLAQKLEVDKKFLDQTASVWKAIEAAQTKFVLLEKELGKEGIQTDTIEKLATALATPGTPVLLKSAEEALVKMKMSQPDVLKLEAAIRNLFGTWGKGAKLIAGFDEGGTVKTEFLKDVAQKALEATKNLDQLNLEYAKLTGTTKERLAAQIQLIQSQEKAEESGKSTGQVTVMQKTAAIQVSDLQIQKDGSIFQNLMKMFDDQMRNMNTNLNLATSLFQSFNQSLDMVSKTVWEMISNFQKIDTFDHGKELGKKLQQLAFNVMNMFGESLTKTMMQSYIEKPLMGLFGIGKDTGIGGGSVSLEYLTSAANAAAESLWGVAGAGGAGGPTGIIGNSASGGGGIMGFLSGLPLIGGLFGGGASIAATPFAAEAAATSDSVSAMYGGLSSSGLSFALPAFADGGITSGPSLAGEAGTPEAVVPLSGGRGIPVNLKGGGGASITIHAPVNVTADAGMDRQAARAQGREISYALQAVVKEQIAKEMRPGGSLNPLVRGGRS